jgi:hypothetical protein
MSVAAFTLQWQNWVITTGTTSTKPKNTCYSSLYQVLNGPKGKKILTIKLCCPQVYIGLFNPRTC